MKFLFTHLKTYVFRGFLAAVPFALAFFTIHLLYVSIDQEIMGLLDDSLSSRFPGLGILLLLLTLYLLGFIASNVLGRRILNIFDRVTSRIPLIKTVYQIGKQLADTFSSPEKQVFKRALLVQYPRAGTWVVGFLTGVVKDAQTGQNLLKIYVPLPPNPLAGLVLMVNEADTRDPGWTVEEALKTIMSGGIIGPSGIR